jgi:hypothetical protein
VLRPAHGVRQLFSAIALLGIAASGCRALFDIDVTYDGAGGAGGASGTAGSGNTVVDDCLVGECDFDDFDVELDCWVKLNASKASQFGVESQELLIIPTDDGSWFNQDVGPFQYQERPGDFLVLVEVAVTSAEDGEPPPGLPNNRAGILIRDPDPDNPGTFLEWSVGSLSESGSEGLAFRSTSGGVTSPAQLLPEMAEVPVDLEEMTLAACRVGDDVHVFAPDASGGWVLLHGEPWAPAGTTQVGVAASAAGQGADIEARFDSVQFFVPPATIEGCAAALAEGLDQCGGG